MPVHLGTRTVTVVARSGLDTQGSCRGNSWEDVGTGLTRGPGHRGVTRHARSHPCFSPRVCAEWGISAFRLLFCCL